LGVPRLSERGGGPVHRKGVAALTNPSSRGGGRAPLPPEGKGTLGFFYPLPAEAPFRHRSVAAKFRAVAKVPEGGLWSRKSASAAATFALLPPSGGSGGRTGTAGGPPPSPRRGGGAGPSNPLENPFGCRRALQGLRASAAFAFALVKGPLPPGRGSAAKGHRRRPSPHRSTEAPLPKPPAGTSEKSRALAAPMPRSRGGAIGAKGGCGPPNIRPHPLLLQEHGRSCG